MIKYISFDMDGTLLDQKFADVVWLTGIPRLYAQKTGLDFAHAREIILQKYNDIGDGELEWYNISYWFKMLNLPGKWEETLAMYASHIRVYPEVCEILPQLARDYPLIILSNAAHEFIELEIKVSGISGFLTHIFSATSDFSMVKKDRNFYLQVCDLLQIKPAELVHVGDHREFDYSVPKAAGIHAVYLDRVNGNANGDEVMNDLTELAPFIARRCVQ